MEGRHQTGPYDLTQIRTEAMAMSCTLHTDCSDSNTAACFTCANNQGKSYYEPTMIHTKEAVAMIVECENMSQRYRRRFVKGVADILYRALRVKQPDLRITWQTWTG